MNLFPKDVSIIWQAKWVSKIQLNVVKIHGSNLSDTWNQWSQECLTPQITVWVHNTYWIFRHLVSLCIYINSLWNYKHRHIKQILFYQIEAEIMLFMLFGWPSKFYIFTFRILLIVLLRYNNIKWSSFSYLQLSCEL